MVKSPLNGWRWYTSIFDGLVQKRNYTWHSIEVQYEGCHEDGLDGEDGDGVSEDRSVGEVEADDYERGQERARLEN